MEKIQANMCFDVVFLYENIGTCLFTPVFLYFLHLVLTFTPHYIIMVKGGYSLYVAQKIIIFAMQCNISTLIIRYPYVESLKFRVATLRKLCML